MTRSALTMCVFFAAGTLSSVSLGQVALYSNAATTLTDPGLATGAVSATGVAAPAGQVWSEAGSGGTNNTSAIAGFSTHAIAGSAGYRFADDFTVSDAAGWRVTGASFFAYQTGNAGIPGAPPFSALNLRVWSGRPGDAGSVVVFGDPATNVLTTITPTNMLRIFNSAASPLPQAPDASRVVWRSDAALAGAGVVLLPGTYWLDWQYTSINPNAEAFTPPVTIIGSRGKAGGNAVQLKFASGMWTPAVDGGKPFYAADVVQDLPFLLEGGVFCKADINLDGTLDPDDLADYIGGFFSQPPDPTADFNGDSIVDPDDLADYIGAFFTGCG